MFAIIAKPNAKPTHDLKFSFLGELNDPITEIGVLQRNFNKQKGKIQAKIISREFIE